MDIFVDDMDELLRIINGHLYFLNGFYYGKRKSMDKDVSRMVKTFGFVYRPNYIWAFADKYCDGEGLSPCDTDDFESALQKFTDYRDLGSLYVSYWIEETEDRDTDPFNDENREPLMMILDVLKRAVKAEIKDD